MVQLIEVPSQKLLRPNPTVGFGRIRSDLVGFGRIRSDSVGFGRIRSDFEEASENEEEEDDGVRAEDKEEEERIIKFLEDTCRCQLRDGKPCSGGLTYGEVMNYRADILQLTRSEVDLVIITAIRNSLHSSFLTSQGTERRYERLCLRFHGERICEKTFLMIHAIGKKKFRNILKHYKTYRSLSSRVHGSSGVRPHNALSFEDTKSVKSFIINYARNNALPLPGRYPGFRDHSILLLESHVTKKSMHDLYVSSCMQANKRSLQYSLFCNLWSKLTPYVVISKPRTDLCTECQQNNFRIIRSANQEESDKKEKLEEQQKHLYHSDRERLVYRLQCKNAKEEWDLSLREGRSPKFAHISFDYAQLIQFPSSPEQAGGLYFLSPRKCHLFGICNESKFQQVNYLIDEMVAIGKDANSIITFLHHYCEKYLHGEEALFIHADNCVGQNKNQFVIMYLLWRVITGKNKRIHLGFMIAGHTKFACDACFGILKRKTKKTFISSITDIAKCVLESSVKSSTNIPEIVGLTNGTLLIQYHDWKTFLQTYFKTFANLTKYHHFEFCVENPLGHINVKEFDDSDSETKKMLIDPKKLPDKHSFPIEVFPCGMTKDRQEYLHKEIRKFCRPGTEDIVAPPVDM